MVDFNLENVASVYSGKNGKCCCGCAGKHRYASAHREWASHDRGYQISDDEVSDRSVMMIANKIKRLGARQDDPSDNHVYAESENGSRLYIAYLRK